ncbi:hypothetical protein GF389_05290 [Candidatus Dojkabacteria bacterium]|nr:hypothetical protein [Candidatus Dojkabacteria bacterium]
MKKCITSPCELNSKRNFYHVDKEIFAEVYEVTNEEVLEKLENITFEDIPFDAISNYS